MRARRRHGAGLANALVALALLGVLVAGAVPWGERAIRRARCLAAARSAASELRRLRAEAVATGRYLGLGLQRDAGGAWLVSVLADGDGDGIRSDDLRTGVDVLRDGPFRAGARWGVEPGFAASLRTLRSPPPEQSPLGDLSDPVRFGTRDIASAGPRGTMTSGTLYLTDGREMQMAVVVLGGSGRVRVWEYRLPAGGWVLR